MSELGPKTGVPVPGRKKGLGLHGGLSCMDYGQRLAAAVDRANLTELGERRAILGKQGKRRGVHEGTTMDGKPVFVAQATKTCPVSGIESST